MKLKGRDGKQIVVFIARIVDAMRLNGNTVLDLDAIRLKMICVENLKGRRKNR